MNKSIFYKKYKKFVSHLWTLPVEKSIVNLILKYNSAIIKDQQKGKEYLQTLYDQNSSLIEDNCSSEFKEELNKLINDYKTETSLNELQDESKYFNKNNTKIYSDVDYFGESKQNNKTMIKENLKLLNKLDEFFYMVESNEVFKQWEEYKNSLLTENEDWIDYVKKTKSNLKEELNIASGLINLHNLKNRVNVFLRTENYLYRPTKDYNFKVTLNSNPYADKEGTIYFDNEESAKQYSDNSRGKYKYVGKESIKESSDINKDAHLNKEKFEEISDYEDEDYLIDDKNVNFKDCLRSIEKKESNNIYNENIHRFKNILGLKKLTEAINDPDYKFYVVSLNQNKILSGWEYKEDAQDFVKEKSDTLGKLKVFTGQFLKQKGLDPNEDSSWGTDMLMEEMTTASISVPDIPALTTTSKVEPTKLIESEDKVFPMSKFPNEANKLKSEDKFDKENTDSKFDPYKKVKNKKEWTEKILSENYTIRDYNLSSKSNCYVFIESNNKRKSVIKFDKIKFAKFIFENVNIAKKYVKDKKFDYYKFLESITFGFKETLIKEYLRKKK